MADRTWFQSGRELFHLFVWKIIQDVLLIYFSPSSWVTRCDIRPQRLLGRVLFGRKWNNICNGSSHIMQGRSNQVQSRASVSICVYSLCWWKDVFRCRYVGMRFKFSVKMWLDFKIGRHYITVKISTFRMEWVMDSVGSW